MRTFIDFLQQPSTLRGDEYVNSYTLNPLRKIKVTTCNCQVDSPFYLQTYVCADGLQSNEGVWPYMTLNVLTETMGR